jgi:hypothetical protein
MEGVMRIKYKLAEGYVVKEWKNGMWITMARGLSYSSARRRCV